MPERTAFPPASSDKVAKDEPPWPAAGEVERDDPDRTGDDLIRLVLAVVETIRQLIERQAICRVDSGSLSEDEVERLGLALLRLEQRMSELKAHFGLSGHDLALKLGPFQELVDEVRLG